MLNSAPCNPTHRSAAAEPQDPSGSLKLHEVHNNLDDSAIADPKATLAHACSKELCAAHQPAYIRQHAVAATAR
jgi:hypothetical protein